MTRRPDVTEKSEAHQTRASKWNFPIISDFGSLNFEDDIASFQNLQSRIEIGKSAIHVHQNALHDIQKFNEGLKSYEGLKVKTMLRFYLFNLRSSWNIIYTSYFTKQKNTITPYKLHIFRLCLAGWRCGFHSADADTTLPTFQAKCNSHPQRSTVLFVLKCWVNEETTIAVSPLFGKKANNWIMSKWIQVVAYIPPRCCSVWIWESSEIWQCKKIIFFQSYFSRFSWIFLVWLWGSVDFRVLAMQSRSLQSQCTCRSSESPLRNASPPELRWKGPFLKIHRNQDMPFKHTQKYIEIHIFNTQHYTSKSQPISTKRTMENPKHGRNNLFKNITETNNIHHIHQALPQKGWCNRCSPHLLGLALEMPRPCTTRLRLPETLWRSRGHRSCRDWWLHRFEWPTNFCSNTPFARQTFFLKYLFFCRLIFFQKLGWGESKWKQLKQILQRCPKSSNHPKTVNKYICRSWSHVDFFAKEKGAVTLLINSHEWA